MKRALAICKVCGKTVSVCKGGELAKHGHSSRNATGAGCSGTGTFEYTPHVPSPKKLTPIAKVRLLRKLLVEAQKKRFREPNSDHYEYCNDCGGNPTNAHTHMDDCLVPRIAKALKETG